MSNWNNPTLTSLYTDTLGELKARDDALATLFAGTQPSNLPNNSVRLSSAEFQRWNGTSWLAVGSVVNSSAQTFSGNKTFANNLTVNGDINNASDIRLKTNIEPLVGALATINRLQGVSFNWKDTNTPSMGVIAQEVETVLPELVKTDSQGGKSVNYLAIIALLVEAVKELEAKLDS
jgi:hypothetical protein